MDMSSKNPAPKFNLAMTALINFDMEEEFDLAFNGLKKDGIVMMGPEEVLNMRKCSWVLDMYGVTWQLV